MSNVTIKDLEAGIDICSLIYFKKRYTLKWEGVNVCRFCLI